jgi:hypothetical protein
MTGVASRRASALVLLAAVIGTAGCDRPTRGEPARMTASAGGLASRDADLAKAVEDAARREGNDSTRREAAAATAMRIGLDRRAAGASDRMVVERATAILGYMSRVKADADCAAMLRGDPRIIARYADRDAERRWMERLLEDRPVATGASRDDAAVPATTTCLAARAILKDAVSRHPDGASGAIRRLGTTSRAPLLREPILQPAQ